MAFTYPALRSVRSWLGRAAREAALYPALMQGREGRRIVFCPSFGKVQSDLLRAYNIATQLQGMGWQALVLPPHLSLSQRRRILHLFRPDAVVLQTCRHALNRIEHFSGWPVILDLDDADFFDPAMRAPLEATARGAQGVICGSRFIRDWASQFCRITTVVWTGTAMTVGPWPGHAGRGRIVTWAQSDPLGYSAEFAFVVDILEMVRQMGEAFVFRLYGWRAGSDHPLLKRLRDAGIETELVAPLPYRDFILSLRDAAVGLSPIIAHEEFSRGKSFGKILGYLDAKVPVICSDEADHAAFFTPDTGIVSNDPTVWVEQIAALLADPHRRQSMADAAHDACRKSLSAEVAARKVADFLREDCHV